MTDAPSKADKLAAYFRTLPPQTVEALVQEVDRARSEDRSDPSHEIILTAVRSFCRKTGIKITRYFDRKRAFFLPFEPFLTDNSNEAVFFGRIYRGVLDPVWDWLTEHNDDNAAFNAQLQAASYLDPKGGLFDPDTEFMDALHQLAISRFDRALDDIGQDEKSRMRLGLQLGGPDGIQSLREMREVLLLRDHLTRFCKALPPTPVAMSPDMAQHLAGLLLHFEPNQLVFPCRILAQHLDSTAHLLPVLLAKAGTDDAGKLVGSPLAPIMNILIDELAIAKAVIAPLVDSLRDMDVLIDALRRFAAISGVIEATVDLSTAEDWRSKIGAHRRDVSDLLRRPTELAFPRLRRLTAGLISDSGRARVIDPEETRDLVRLVVALKPYRAEIALNELLTTTHRQIEDLVDTSGKMAADRMRTVQGIKRDELLPRFEMFLEIAEIVYGDVYALSLRRMGRLPERDPGAQTTAEEQVMSEATAA
ncbi:MAG: hypothetical protein AAFX39_06215 [Pseudomonadota bacterium]